MKILKLQKNKILFENGVEISHQKKTIDEYKLKEGIDLAKDIYLELVERAVLSFSYWLLEKRDYSVREITTKLVMKYREKDIVLKIVEKLKGHNYLNDRDFAVSFINCHKSWGSRKLEYNLLMKGVDRNIIRELLEDNQDDEIEEIKKLWIKMGDKEERKKVESLMRKGFQYSAIREAKKEL